MPVEEPAGAELVHHRLSPRHRRAALLGTFAVIAALVVINIGSHLLHTGRVAVSVAAAAALLAFARHRGLTWAQLGLSRDRLRAGALWAVGVITLVGGVYLAGVLMPETRAAFLDSRYHLGLARALFTAFFVIPLGTILLEEVAFRSVLWGMLSRHMTTRRVVLVSSLLFGLWHILPSLHMASANRAVSEVLPVASPAANVIVVVGTVLFTALGGVVAGELRRRSGSLLASVGMHWATNSLGVLFGLVAWQLAS